MASSELLSNVSADTMDKKHDAFCWKCCKKETTLKCSTCQRSFHIECTPDDIKPANTPDNNWFCSVCIKITNSKNTPEQLQRISTIASVFKRSEFIDLCYKRRSIKKQGKKRRLSEMDEYSRSAFRNIYEPFFANTIDLVNPIDLPKIIEKVNLYTSFEEFLADVQWFVHNCEIKFTDGHHKTTEAKKLLKLVNAEIESCLKCLECHVNANDKTTRTRWFTMVCNMPHLIIWAHRKNTRYWPAKLMSIDDDKQQVFVRYFGSYHINEKVAINKCFLYSEMSPGKMRASKSKPNDIEYAKARKEADEYINNIRQKYGSFELAESKTPFDPSKYDDYIRVFISKVPKSPTIVAETNRTENAATDSMQYIHRNPFIPIKIEQSVSIEDINELFGNPSTGQINDNEEDIGGNFDDDQKMDTEDDESTISDQNFAINTTEDDLDLPDVSDYKNSLQHFTHGFNRVCKMNATLKKRLRDMGRKHELDVETLKNEHRNEIETLNKAHEQEIKRLTDDQQSLIDERKQAIIEQCKQENAQLLEDAKKNKYCLGCGNSKPLDIYVCNIECQGRYLKN